MKEQSSTIVGIDWSADSHTCYDLQADKTFKITDSVPVFPVTNYRSQVRSFYQPSFSTILFCIQVR